MQKTIFGALALASESMVNGISLTAAGASWAKLLPLYFWEKQPCILMWMPVPWRRDEHPCCKRRIDRYFSQLVPNLQIFLGLDWGSCLDCDKYYLGINAGWETNIYWNQFNIPRTNANP